MNGIGAKTVELAIGRCAQAVAAREEAEAVAVAKDERAVAVTEKAFTHPSRL